MYVQDYMSPKPPTVELGSTLEHAVRLMARHGVEALAVVDAAGRTAGLISALDAAAALMSNAAPAGSLNVAGAMTRDPVTVPVGRRVHDALGLFARSRAAALPVTDRGKLDGLLTRHDVMRAFSDLLGLNETGSVVEVALPGGCLDLADAFHALVGDDGLISAIVSRTRRRDGSEPSLLIRMKDESSRHAAAKLRSAALILLAPDPPEDGEVTGPEGRRVVNGNSHSQRR
jgi:CBS domain-containing protein